MVHSLVDFNDLTISEWEELCDTALDIYDNLEKYSDRCKGKILAALFYEPSTRTKFSFEAAMIKLGGSVMGFSGTESSSVSKGESLKDTIKIVSNYVDVIVLRHSNEGAAFAASLFSDVPVINAGDGGHLHPTQTMTDLFTIRKLKGELKNLNIGVCGDLLYGRTVHSLLKALSMYTGNNFYFISTPELAVPENFTHELKKGNKITICNTIEECIGELDILYMTRIQKERFGSDAEYERQRGIYILDSEKLKNAKGDLTILHPLPKNEEIAPEVDDDIRAKYFKQAQLGLYIRMALLIKITENASRISVTANAVSGSAIKCENPNCVTYRETGLPNINNGEVCSYCENSVPLF